MEYKESYIYLEEVKKHSKRVHPWTYLEESGEKMVFLFKEYYVDPCKVTKEEFIKYLELTIEEDAAYKGSCERYKDLIRVAKGELAIEKYKEMHPNLGVIDAGIAYLTTTPGHNDPHVEYIG